MQEKLIKVFKKATYEYDINEVNRIWHTIITRDKYNARLKLWAFSFTGLASLAGLTLTFRMLLNDLTQSGFSEYFSLIFSDSGLIISYWKELVFSLAESLPIMSTIFTLSLIFVFLLSLRYMMKQIFKEQLIDFVSLSI